jgi:hypothetical protein
MFKRALVSTALIGSLSLAPLTGCENLPGNSKQQGTVIGGAGGAAIGAAVAKNNRLLGALIGGALGAGGGYLIGANKDKITGNDKEKSRDEAIQAAQRAEQNPARTEDVNNTRTADLNNDGFVTLDEVVALRNANLSDREIIDRLERTNQVFELTPWQEDYLQQRGVSRQVIDQMRSLNRDTAAQPVGDYSPRSVPSDDRFRTSGNSTSTNDQGDRLRRYDDRGDKNDLGRFDQDRFDNSGSLDRFH